MSDLISASRNLAIELHEGQFRGNEPYVTHPGRVAGYLASLNCDDVTVSAAWLHDAVEDCGVTVETLNRRILAYFGSTSYQKFLINCVCYVVNELTNPSKQFPNLSRSKRKAMDREHIRKGSLTAKIIKLVDRMDNLREFIYKPDTKPKEFLAMYAEESRLLFEAIKASFPPAISNSDRIIVDSFKETLDRATEVGFARKLAVAP